MAEAFRVSQCWGIQNLYLISKKCRCAGVRRLEQIVFCIRRVLGLESYRQLLFSPGYEFDSPVGS